MALGQTVEGTGPEWGREGFLSPAIRSAGWYGHVWPSSPGWRHQGFPRALRMLNLEFLGKARILGVGRTGPCLWGAQSLLGRFFTCFSLGHLALAVLTPLMWWFIGANGLRNGAETRLTLITAEEAPSQENAVGAAGRGADS